MQAKTEYCNIPKSIQDKLNLKLYKKPNHPVCILKNKIYEYFLSDKYGLNKYNFNIFEDLSPLVPTQDNFDKLLIQNNHPARSKSDTYYLNESTVLRTHTTAHQNNLLSQNYTAFLIVGDVYRKDEIDKKHYPVFHQLEGVLLFDIINSEQETKNYINLKLQEILAGLVQFLFPGIKYRFNSDYFPFTDPSYEMEIQFNSDWMEILGCGLIQKQILLNNNIFNKLGIAWGFGLDRLALTCFDIPDIRYLWSSHEKFLNQFSEGKITKFKPYSLLNNISKDISFWVPQNNIQKNNKWLQENDFFELIRENSDDLIEKVELLNIYEKNNLYSRTYKMVYSPKDPSITDPAEFNKIINQHQDNFRNIIQNKLGIQLR